MPDDPATPGPDPMCMDANAGAWAMAWLETGQHLMVVGSKEVLKGHPSGPGPDTKAPYVMWADTPYAHLMIPVG